MISCEACDTDDHCDRDSDSDADADQTSIWEDEDSELNQSLLDYGELLGSWRCHYFVCSAFHLKENYPISNTPRRQRASDLDALKTS